MADNAAIIWNYFKDKGFSDCGIAGLMGNLYAESGLIPTNLQNDFEKKLGMTDSEYTIAVDNGLYNNFIRDSAGYGLAQWTYWTRKLNLLKYCQAKRKSIGDLYSQLDFLYEELTTSYSNIVQTLKSSTSIEQASNAVLLQFEQPANQGIEVQLLRAKYAQQYYNRFHEKEGEINMIAINKTIKCNPGNYTTGNQSRKIRYIVIHYTGNSKDTAVANAKYFASNANAQASAHYFVDDYEIYQSVQNKDVAWHCGTSKQYYHMECRNSNSIGIEMCCTAGNYKVSEQTIKNTIQLCAQLCKTYGITIDRIVRHYDVTHKNCPAQMAGENNLEWLRFKNQIQDILDGVINKVEEDDEDMTQESFNKMMDEYIKQLSKKPATWEQEALLWAQGNGILNGDETGNLMPKKFITRGEMAKALQNLLNKLK